MILLRWLAISLFKMYFSLKAKSPAKVKTFIKHPIGVAKEAKKMALPNDDMKQHLMRKISINRQASRSAITNWVIGNTTQERVLQRIPSQLNMPMQDDYMQVSLKI